MTIKLFVFWLSLNSKFKKSKKQKTLWNDHSLFSVINEISKRIDHILDLLLIIFKVLSSIKNQHSFGVIGVKPVFMLDVNFLQILKRNLVFFWSLSGLCPLVTLFWWTLQVNDFCSFLRSHGLKTTVKTLEDFMLAFVHISVVFHQLWKDVLIGQNASFWNFKFVWVSLHGLLELLDSGENGVNLEGEPPSCWLFVVFLKHIDVFSAEILPVFDRLLDPLSLRNTLS